jgi:hypothetical protein|tara:strand:- start:417 stop:1181 length:765 start_codon:yes stop_codon:yes gene_type:complete
VAAVARPNFFPGSTPPKHLDGTMPGDYGFDPLGLGKIRLQAKPKFPFTTHTSSLFASYIHVRLLFVIDLFITTAGEDKAALEWYQQAELMHARWAMLGVAGMAAPEILGNPLVDGPLPNWAEAPFFDGYVADANTLFVVQMFMMNWAEVRRWQDIKNPGSVHADPYDESRRCTGTDVGYPGGGLFNPMGMAKSAEEQKTLRAKEIANGRLAMVAAMGCFIQHDVTGTGPVQNLKAHLADPSHVTIFQNFHPFAF